MGSGRDCSGSLTCRASCVYSSLICPSDNIGILISALKMLPEMDDRSRTPSEGAPAEFDLRRAGDDVWVVEARSSGTSEPPLELIFKGPTGYEEALRFLLHCGT